MLDGLEPPRGIEVYDRFIWNLYMNQLPVVHLGEDRPAVGDVFLHRTMRNLLEHNPANLDRARLHVVDLAKAAPFGRPISWLFVDAMKSQEIARGICSAFLPFVEVGGWVLDQDFFWQPNANVFRLSIWHQLDRRGLISPIWKMGQGSMIVWRINKPINLSTAADCLGTFHNGDLVAIASWFDGLRKA